jgi:DNA polymerase-3 subunit delta'
MFYPWLKQPWARFQERLAGDRLAHAILLHGPEGTGKLELAQTMAARLLCTQDGEFACGACRSCQLYSTGAHPDWFVLEPEEGKHQIIIDRVRETIAALSLTSSFSKRKVALICPAELMNRNSANALLKCLEEPPGDTVLLLVSHDPSRLPVTIRSRCQSIAVVLPEPGLAAQWLSENHAMDEGLARSALIAAAGSPLKAVDLQESGALASHQAMLANLTALMHSPEKVSVLAQQLADIEPRTLWAWLSSSCADALRASLGGHTDAWLEQSASLDSKGLSALQQQADRNRNLSRTPVRQDLLLVDWLIKWSQLANQQQGN